MGRVADTPADVTLHVTLAYLGPLNAEGLDLHKQLIQSLLTRQSGWPDTGLWFSSVHKDFFGPKRDMPVWRLRMRGEPNKSGLKPYDLWLDYYRTWNVVPPGMTEKFEAPNYHVTLKSDRAEQWVMGQADLNSTKMLHCPTILLKQVGARNPEATFSAKTI